MPGKGLQGKVAGKVIAGGNADFIRETCELTSDLERAGEEMSRDGVTAPIASATSLAQVESFARAAALSLSAGQLARLDTASA